MAHDHRRDEGSQMAVLGESAPRVDLPFATDLCPRNVMQALVEHDWTSDAFKPIQLVASSKVSQVFRALVLKPPRKVTSWKRDRVMGKISEGSSFSEAARDDDGDSPEISVVVLKVYEKKRMKDVHHRNVRREILIHRDHARCVHVVPLFAALEDRSCYYLVQKEETRGDLFRELRRGMIQALTLSEQFNFKNGAAGNGGRTLNCLYANERRCASEVVKPLLCLLVHLHSRGVVHRDIKPENILLASWTEGDERQAEKADTVEAKLIRGHWPQQGHADSSDAPRRQSSSPKARGCAAVLCTLAGGGSRRQAQRRYDQHLMKRARKGFKIQLCDFGLAIDTNVSTPTIRVGTVDYMAPELLRCPTDADLRELHKVEKLRTALLAERKSPSNSDLAGLANAAQRKPRYDQGVDVWAVGVLLYELLVGNPPFGSQLDCDDRTEGRILEGNVPFPHGVVSPLAKSFILKALTYNWDERPTALELIRHPWITKYCGDIQVLQPKAAAAAAGKGKQEPFRRLSSKNLDTLLWRVI